MYGKYGIYKKVDVRLRSEDIFPVRRIVRCRWLLDTATSTFCYQHGLIGVSSDLTECLRKVYGRFISGGAILSDVEGLNGLKKENEVGSSKRGIVSFSGHV